jgi:scyllo-inositol 2-dehydrogenase (NADP+)
MNKMNVGLIGYGLSGAVFHAPFLLALDEFELKSIVSSKKDIIKKDYPDVEVVSSFEEVVNDPDIHLVVITTPNHLHFSQAKEALEKGKHVVVEKPFVPTLEEGEELIELAKQKELVLSVFHNRRFDGDFMTVKRLIEEEKLGDVVYFESHFDRFRPNIGKKNWREEKETVAGGVLFDLGPHLIDQAFYLFGEPEEIIVDKALQREGSTQDDYFHVIMKYPRLRCVLHASSIAAKPGNRFVVHGTKGSLVIKGMDPQEGRLKQGMKPGPELGEHENFCKFYDEKGNESEVVIEDGDYSLYYKKLFTHICDQGPNPARAEDSLFNIKVILNS